MDWWHTANVLAQTANMNRAKHSPKVKPQQFNPFAKKTKPKEATQEEIQKLLGPDWQKYV